MTNSMNWPRVWPIRRAVRSAEAIRRQPRGNRAGSAGVNDPTSHRPIPGSAFERLVFFLQRQKIPLLAARDEALGDRFQFLPASADLLGFFFCDLIIGGGSGNDC